MKLIPVILLLLLFSKASSTSWPVEVNVQGGIHGAIQKAGAGDTLLIHSGLYREGNILVNKSLVILGDGWPVIDGEQKYENFTVTADHVVIRGLKFINTGASNVEDQAAITGDELHDLQVIDNRFENAFFGIRLTGATQCLIKGNQLKASRLTDNQSGNGIHMWKCDQIEVIGNDIQGHRDGIYFEFVTHSTIKGNVSHGNMRYGLHFMFSNDDEYRGNTFRDNGAGVAVMFSHGVKMFENTFIENWGSAAYGLLLKEISDCEIERNRFVRNTIGVYLEGVSRGSFIRNMFQENGWAVKLQASSIENTFKENNFIGNTFDLSTNGSMMANTLEANYWDKYEGYDLQHDGVGDVPFHPVSLYSMIVEKMPTAVMLWRSFLVFMLDRTEKMIPAVIPENLKDDFPQMKAYDIRS